ncbi:MAG TPA: mandelate racemase/muconate lactonizing enzyme family protein [Acidimicrobiales bacterium]|nr:mandelate racemase/muconate lactonizing enzyme family protein [Acidimicrobiales bacterium]
MSVEESRITEVRVFSYDLTYAHGTYVMSKGREVRVLKSVVAAVTSASGRTGYGEVCPLGTAYLPGFEGGILAALTHIAPALLGADAQSLAGVRQVMDQALRGHGYAKSVLDIACFDLLGQISGLPCHALLGGRLQDHFPLYMAVPLGSPEQMAGFVHRSRASGIHRFQLKVGGIPAEDADRVRAVVEATGEGDVIVADANGAWRLQDATVMARMVERMPRVRLEQPCPTIEECILLRRLTSMPMILDEVITDVAALIRCYEAGALDAVNLKISRVGGLAPARDIRQLAEEMGLKLTVEDTWGGDLTTAAVAHLASTAASGTFFAASFMNDWTLEHVAGYEPRSTEGWGYAPDGPGLGVRVDEEALGQPVQCYP